MHGKADWRARLHLDTVIVHDVNAGFVGATVDVFNGELVGAGPVSYTHLTLPTIYSV